MSHKKLLAAVRLAGFLSFILALLLKRIFYLKLLPVSHMSFSAKKRNHTYFTLRKNSSEEERSRSNFGSKT